ncbi:hypothetical protein BDN70DRAFT_902386 [Pholiota conissans]|uniref:Uncharacterized protein n=1 Tax=Pholiota conissans TaxID=109636 RepID=A0A9P5YK45_9AGAR|nr:hypothetical protein BDN70DRAFT_902386 [Pholiota conissans]
MPENKPPTQGMPCLNSPANVRVDAQGQTIMPLPTTTSVESIGIFVPGTPDRKEAKSAEGIDLYFFNKPLEDDAAYPLYMKIVIGDDNFLYSAYPDLMKILDPAVVHLEVFHRNKIDWTPLNATTGLDSSFWKGRYGGDNHFLIMRRADHGLIDKKCIGLPELILETHLQEFSEALRHKAVVLTEEIAWELDDDAGKMAWDVEGLLVKPSWHLAKYPYYHPAKSY